MISNILRKRKEESAARSNISTVQNSGTTPLIFLRFMIGFLVIHTTVVSGITALAAAPLDEGNRAFIAKEYQQAILKYGDVFQNAMYRDDIPAALYQTGECYQRLGDWEMARRAYWKVCMEYPKSSFSDNAYLNIADYTATQGKDRLSEAVVLYETIITRYPNSDCEPLAWIGLARARSGLNFLDGAENALLRFIDKSPDIPLLADAYFELGQIYSNPVNPSRDLGKAISSYKKLIEKYSLSPHLVSAYFALGNVSWEIGSYEQAIRYYHEVVTRAPDSYLAPLAQTNIGLCYRDMNDYEKAIEANRYLLEKFPQPKSVQESIRKLIEHLESKTKDKLQVSAWIANVDKETKIGTYEGEVRIILGKTTISSDYAQVDLQSDRINARGNVHLNWGLDLSIIGDQIECNLGDRMCIVKGNVKIRRHLNNDVVEETWDRIEFSMNDGSLLGHNNQ